MMAQKALGFGLIGTGMIASFHAKAIKALEEKHNIRLVGVAARALEKANDFAKCHQVSFATDKVEELVARPDIDVVCILTPSGAHLEPALAAIAAGKNVIIEKPLEITTARVDQILATAKAANVKVGAIFQARFSKGARLVKQALDAGRLGPLVLCSAYVKWHRSDAYYTGWKGTLALDGGGAVINQSIHAIDLLQWLVGMPSEVFSWKTRAVHKKIEAEDTAVASLRFPHGALGSIEATTATWPGWERRIDICGQHGSVAIEDDRIVHWDFATPLPEDDAIRASIGQQGAGSGASAPDQISFEGHKQQIEEMVLSIRNGTPLSVDGHQARNAVALIEAMYQSAESEMAVGVEDFVE